MCSSSAGTSPALLLRFIAVEHVGGPTLLLIWAHLLAPCTDSGSGGPPTSTTAMDLSSSAGFGPPLLLRVAPAGGGGTT